MKTRISSIEKKQDESRGDNKWNSYSSTLICSRFVNITIIIKYNSAMKLHSEALSKGGRPKPKGWRQMKTQEKVTQVINLL